MVDIQSYMEKLLKKLKMVFNTRLLYVGLQGSYYRGEETPDSDMDIMVILDVLTVEDMKRYRDIVEQLPEPEHSCGFICGKEDLLHWNRGEICQLIYGTMDYYGRLREFVPSFSEEDIRNHIRVSVDNLYHEICHRLIHGSKEKNRNNLVFSYKTVFYILQNVYYLKTGIFSRTKKELIRHLEEKDKQVMEWAERVKIDPEYSFSEAYQILFSWCQKLLTDY